MPSQTRVLRAALCLTLCLFLSIAVATPRSFVPSFDIPPLDRMLQIPVVHLPEPPAAPAPVVAAVKAPEQPAPSTCRVGPIPPLDNDEARSLEAAAGTAEVVDRSGLTSATRIALEHFERSIASLGGKIEVTSAYRPPAYQAHLQVIWDKWMQLRGRMEKGCAVIRAQVDSEFKRHGLLTSQRPVPASDHTRGVGFDAAVLLRRGRSIDHLALVAGVRRPDVVHDPVHFRLIQGRR